MICPKEKKFKISSLLKVFSQKYKKTTVCTWSSNSKCIPHFRITYIFGLQAEELEMSKLKMQSR